jgi:ADP-ribose pyrophosphatase YjhB (NUDIX family)
VGELAGWTYCPRCRTTLSGDQRRLECPQCGLVVYASAKPTACALVTDPDGRLLLARRRHDPFAGRWDFPGGFVEEDEHPLDAVRRELREETGLEVEPGDFVGVWVDRYGAGDEAKATLNLYWSAQVVSGEPRPMDDVAELRWFAPEELPGADETAFHVSDVLAAWRHQDA